jgi:hypothetical protein
MSNFEVLGIGLKNSDTRFKPQKSIKTTTAELAGQTNGKLFVAIRDTDSNLPNALQLIVNGYPVEIRQNERWMQTNSEQPIESGETVLAFDFPMRLVDGVKKPATYAIQFIKGVIRGQTFIESGESAEYTLVITGDELPEPKYDQAVDGD